MPLLKGKSKAVVEKNISELSHQGSRPRSKKQIVAIALSVAGKSNKPRRSSGRGR